MLLQFTFVYVPAEICGRQKNNYSAMPQTKDCSEILEAVCASTFFQEYETYHSYLMKDCTSVRAELR